MLLGPEEFREENDDFEGSTGRSAIEADLTESGTYRVIVTSYQPGEEGAYTLELGTADASASSGQRDVERLEPGVRASGTLREGDGTIETGEYRDLWAFEGRAGENVVVVLGAQADTEAQAGPARCRLARPVDHDFSSSGVKRPPWIFRQVSLSMCSQPWPLQALLPAQE